MKKFILTEDELTTLLMYEIIYKYEYWKEKNNLLNACFSDYLQHNTPYQPDHECIQSHCRTAQEHSDPIGTKIYDRIFPIDIAKYQANHYYHSINTKRHYE